MAQANKAHPQRLDQYNTQVDGRDLRNNHLLPTLNMTKPRLAFSRLQTLFGSSDRTLFAGEASLVGRGTINVEPDFDVQELDYYEVRRQEAPLSAKVGPIHT